MIAGFFSKATGGYTAQYSPVFPKIFPDTADQTLSSSPKYWRREILGQYQAACVTVNHCYTIPGPTLGLGFELRFLDGERLEEVVDLAFLVEVSTPTWHGNRMASSMGAIYGHFKRENNDGPQDFALDLKGKWRGPLYPLVI